MLAHTSPASARRMLRSNFIKFLALVGFAILLLLLVGSSGGQAEQDEATKSEHKPTPDNKGKIPLIPPIDEDFTKLLGQVIDDEELTKTIAQYMEIAPSSHRSRSSITSFVAALTPHISGEKTDNQSAEKKENKDVNSTAIKFDPRPKNPMKKLVKMIIEMGHCEDGKDCSDMVCSLLNRRKKKNGKKHDRMAKPQNRHFPDECTKPCPVPDFCPLPDICKKCPAKPVCPCNFEPSGALIPESGSSTTATTKASETKSARHGLHHGGRLKLLGSPTAADRPSLGKTIKPPCWLLGENCTSTTTSTMRPIGVSTTTMRSASTTRKATSSSTTSKMTSSSTTRKMAPSPSSTKKMASSSTTQRMTSSSTTSKMVPSSSTTKPDSTSTSQKPSSSTSMRPTESMSSMKPKSSTTTTMMAKTTSTTTKGKRKVIKETDEKSSESKKVINVDGKKTKFTATNSTKSDLEYLQLETGLKILIRNKTVVQYITDAVNALPPRSGGVEGHLADRVLRNFGEDMNRWKVQSKGGSARSMTYSTLKRNLVHILRNIVAAVIRKKCKNCAEKCKEAELPDDELVCSGQDDSSIAAATTTTTAPTTKSSTTRRQYRTGHGEDKPLSSQPHTCENCWMESKKCPAPPGCMEYTCPHSAMSCRFWTTTVAPSKSPSSSSTSIKPSSASTSTKSSSSSPPTTTQKSPATSSKPTPNHLKHDPDFLPEWSPRLEKDSPGQQLDDMDPGNQIEDEDRFKELACKGSICGDQKSCGAADLNELTPRKKQSGYIVNGEKQKYGEWPSYAKIEISISALEKSLCGGVLISKRHVLTAGHCVRVPKAESNEAHESDLMDADQLEVILGEHQRDKEDKFEVSHRVDKICFSSKFNNPRDEGSRFDFAILTLSEEVNLNHHVQPACLPYKPFPIGKSKCFVVGQGKMRDNSTDYYLSTPEFIQKMPVGRKACSGWGFNEHDRSRWCFTKVNGQGDSCNGDSGGPILCRNKDNKWYVMGLVSYGSELCDGSESPGWVAVYTRVPAILEQIHLDCLNDDS